MLNNPLGRLPLPEMDMDSVAVTITLPPSPAPVVLLTTCAPPVRLSVFAFREISPALPAPVVATEIIPPSPIVSAGVVTAIWPALPVLSAVLKSPLAAVPLPEMDREPGALTVTLPP